MLLIKDLNTRTKRIEQILPTLATKEEKALATKDDLKAYATKDDLKAFATKEDMREEGKLTRQHFEVVADGLRESIKVIGQARTDAGAATRTRSPTSSSVSMRQQRSRMRST